jgi:hypothetical protein
MYVQAKNTAINALIYLKMADIVQVATDIINGV